MTNVCTWYRKKRESVQREQRDAAIDALEEILVFIADREPSPSPPILPQTQLSLPVDTHAFQEGQGAEGDGIQLDDLIWTTLLIGCDIERVMDRLHDVWILFILCLYAVVLVLTRARTGGGGGDEGREGTPGTSSPFCVGPVISSLRVKLRWAQMYLNQIQLHFLFSKSFQKYCRL